jgi:hypothetical protein
VREDEPVEGIRRGVEHPAHERTFRRLLVKGDRRRWGGLRCAHDGKRNGTASPARSDPGRAR